MAYYKEIVTKAVIGKGKKTKKEDYVIETNEKIDNVLGCWVINHNFRGSVVNNSIIVSGSYDVNIWYSYLNNTKTNVMIKKFSYEYPMNVNIKEKGYYITESCIGCGTCRKHCPQKCIEKGTTFVIRQEHCLHCGNCYEKCPVKAVIRK